jgi:KAP family P-loop domain
MSAQPPPREPKENPEVGLLAVLDPDLQSQVPFSIAGGSFRITEVESLALARNELQRAGYRYRWVVIQEQGKDPKEIAEFSALCEQRYPWLEARVVKVGASLELPDVPPSKPLPPFLAGDTRPYREVGPLLIALSHCDHPWDLEADAIVLPGGTKGGRLGSLASAWALSAPEVVDRLDGAPFAAPTTPVLRGRADWKGALGQHLLLATAKGDHGATVGLAVDACIASLRSLCEVGGVSTVVLPLIGTGGNGLDAAKVLRGLLEEIDLGESWGGLKHILVPLEDKQLFDGLVEAGDADPQHPRAEIQNDTPRGPDLLGVQSDVYALADAVALKTLEPPLVIGILGGWGTGKSFALKLFRDRLRELRSWDVSTDEAREAFPFVGHPYLVEFDAWTYAKENLWASLMHKIFEDLNQQLELERVAGAKVMRAGLDIWPILAGLSRDERKDLYSELAAKSFDEGLFDKLVGFQTEGGVTETLWNALKKERAEERARLAKAKRELRQAEEQHEAQRRELEQELHATAGAATAQVEAYVTEKTRDLDAKLANLETELESTAKRIQAEPLEVDEAELARDAWQPTLDRLKAVVVGPVLDKAKATTDPARGSVLALYAEARKVANVVRDLGVPGAAFLLAGTATVAGFGMWVLSQTQGLWPTLAAIAAPITTFAASWTRTLGGIRGRLEREQQTFHGELSERRTAREARAAHEVEQRVALATGELRKEIAHVQSERQAAAARARAERSQDIESRRARLGADLAGSQREYEQRRTELLARVEEHRRLVGLASTRRSLRELIRERLDSGNYEQHLGLVHQVKADLDELTGALLPIDGHDPDHFPRGEPRIVIVIDDLDRCPPAQVVEVLEAAQLLVKTRLFVVVIAMDVRYVTRALEKRYEGVLIPDGVPSGLDYIEKIVQVPYRVPDISPKALRPFLAAQMRVAVDEKVKQRTETGGSGAGNTVAIFESTQEPPYKSTEALPSRVQEFTPEELELLERSCKAAEIGPRAGKRLVNILKLIKIIWFHRGEHREPDDDVKQGMMLLLALAARQPLIMRDMLRHLDGLLRRREQLGAKLPTLIQNRLLISQHPGNQTAVAHLLSVLGDATLMPCDLELAQVGEDNMRLVRSFSFVGETVEDFDAPAIVDPVP